MSNIASGIANPIGLKCGPSAGADDLLRLIDRLDPDNRPGRLVLIGRFGAGKARRAPAGADAGDARRRAARRIWSIDPMHGNTVDRRRPQDPAARPTSSPRCRTFFDSRRGRGRPCRRRPSRDDRRGRHRMPRRQPAACARRICRAAISPIATRASTRRRRSTSPPRSPRLHRGRRRARRRDAA